MSASAVFSVKLFNDSVAGIVIGHAAHLGILDELARSGRFEPGSFCETNRLNSKVVDRLLYVLRSVGVIDSDSDNGWKQGPLFQDAHQNAGYFEWLVLGYGGLLSRADIGFAAKNGSELGRNGFAIASASARIGARYVDETLNQVIDSQPFDSLIDLGCGKAARLVSLAQRYPALRGTGIELDQTAVRAANDWVRTAGLEDRIHILHADVGALNPTECKKLPQDVIMMNFMGHDMWPRENAILVFRRLRDCFPNCKRFILADTLNSGWTGGKAAGLFTVGFELIHTAMGKYIPTESEWMELLPQTGWAVRRVTPLPIPHTKIFELVPSEPK